MIDRRDVLELDKLSNGGHTFNPHGIVYLKVVENAIQA